MTRPVARAETARAARIRTGAAASLATAYLGVAYWIDPYADRAIGCPVHMTTGGYCPGCGSTRAVHELLHGDLPASLAAHPLLLPALALAGAAVLTRHRRPAGNRWPGATRPGGPSSTTWAPIALLGALILLTVVRNLPGGGLLVPPSIS